MKMSSFPELCGEATLHSLCQGLLWIAVSTGNPQPTNVPNEVHTLSNLFISSFFNDALLSGADYIESNEMVIKWIMKGKYVWKEAVVA
jgi:hypothetical protein